MVIGDVAEQTAMQPWVEMEFFQLGCGRQVGQLDSVDLGTQQIVRERQDVAVQKIGVTPANLCTVSCCTLDPAFRFSEVRAGETDAVFFLPGNTEFDVYVPTGARTTYVSLDQDAFLRGMRVLNRAGWEDAPKQLVAIPAARQAMFEGVVDQWLGAAGADGARTQALDAERMRHLVLQEILEIVAASQREEPTPLDRLRAFDICRAARGYVEDRLANDRLPTIVDICQEFGVSERALQYAFQSYVAMSPLVYLRRCRLNRVRAVLSRPASAETTVTEVATRFGFFHLGKFAQSYRRHFGETPSTTLARALK